VATAPYSLYLDIAPISSAVRAASTVTITTSSAHGLVSGSYVWIENTTATAGTSMVGVYPITVTGTATFTYTAAGTAGTATVGSAVASVDVLNPLTNYTTVANRQGALYVELDTLSLTANGDGSGATMAATINQEVTPTTGPWFKLVPDQTRVRFAFANTGTTPASSDLLFLGFLNGFTSRLNESGLGTITDLDINDVNVALDKVGVFGRAGGVAAVQGGVQGNGPTRSSNVVTLTTKKVHGFVAGQTITVQDVPGGSGTSFNGTYAIASVPSSTQITYAQTGSNYSFPTNGAISYTVTRDGRSATSVIITAATSDSAYVQSGRPIALYKGSCRALNFSNNTQVENLLFSTEPNLALIHSGTNVTRISDTSFRLVLPRPISGSIPGTATFSGNCRVFQTGGIIFDGTNTGGQTSFIIPAGTTETAAVTSILSSVNAWHSDDYPLQRLISTSGTALIQGGSAYKPPEAFYLTTTSLRSALDSVVETYQSDTRLRRYYVTPQGQLSYQLIDSDAIPTYANAPYKITTTSYGTPNTTTAAASIAPFNLTVGWDHDTTKRAQFNIPKTGATSDVINTVMTYTDAATDNGGTAATGTAVSTYTARAGAPIFETVVDFPNATQALLPVVASAWFKERHQPLLSGSFELRGAGTAAHNTLGFFKGYYQSGAASYAITSWAPGQFVDITSPGLGLSGLYRVEEVSLSLEPGSYQQIINVTFNRKSSADLASIIANIRR
jgi:hypothetical protein